MTAHSGPRKGNLLRDGDSYARCVSLGYSINGKEFRVLEIAGVTEGGYFLPIHQETLAAIFEVIG